MQISLRSHLIAGTAAVVGASAMAMTPIAPAHISAPSLNLPAAANVALAGFDSPITELFNTFNLLPGLVFSNTSLPPAFGPTPNPVSKVGLVPQIINDALPVVRALGVNGSAYLQSTLNAVTITGQTASEAIWNLPQAVIESVTTLSLTPLINAILTPINTIGTTLLAAGNYVLQGVIARATAVVNGFIASAPLLVQAVIGQVTSLVNTAVYVGQSVIGAGSIEGSWNAAVNGLFGPGTAFSPIGTPAPSYTPSIPGALVNLTVGLGQPVDPTANPSGSNAFVPSVRTVVSGLVQSLKAEVSTANPAPAVPTPPPAAALKAKARAAASVRSAASVAAPEAAAPAGDSAAAATSAPAEKPATNRASRKSVRSASAN